MAVAGVGRDRMTYVMLHQNTYTQMHAHIFTVCFSFPQQVHTEVQTWIIQATPTMQCAAAVRS